MTSSRHRPWPGTWNTRDRGGLPLRSGGTTRWGSVVRGDNPDAMTATGWSAAWDYRESTARLDPYSRERGLGDQTEKIENLVASHGTTIEESLTTTVDGWDAEAYLRTHGLSADEIDAVRMRLTNV